MDRKRWWFNLVAIVTLAGFAIFTAFVTIGAIIAPRYRPDPDAGYRIESERPTRVRFRPDDSRVEFDVVTTLRKSPLEAKTKYDRKSVPTGRRNDGARAMDFAKSTGVIQRLMALASFDLAEPPVLSHDHQEVAFITREQAVVRRAESNKYISMGGTPLPDWAEKLNQVRTGTAAERLANPSLEIWADAAIETVLRQGALPAIHADRLIAGRERDDDARRLADILLAHDGPATLDEVARTVNGTRDAALQRHLLDMAVQRGARYLKRTDGTVVPATSARAAVVEALAKRDWGEKPPGVLVDWILSFFEGGGLETVSSELAALLMTRLTPGIDASHTTRLEGLLNQRGGPDGAAAYLLLRRLAGQPVDAPLNARTAEEGRAWLAARKNPK